MQLAVSVAALAPNVSGPVFEHTVEPGRAVQLDTGPARLGRQFVDSLLDGSHVVVSSG
jgi:hypothetical protein